MRPVGKHIDLVLFSLHTIKAKLQMKKQTIESFPPEVISKLQFYVYRLIDPRNGETFYVGNGTGNRVFVHAAAAQNLDGDDHNNKMKRIREIRLAGFEVGHVIHRHGLSKSTAEHVEASLIDCYPGLTNITGGIGSSAYGTMHAREIVERYSAKEAVFQHRVLMINVNRSATEMSLYRATRFAWRIDKRKASNAEVILAVRRGLIEEAFVAHEWLEATLANFPDFEDVPGRYGFVGEPASLEIQKLYKRKLVPARYRKRGASNPIKYSW